MQLAEARNKMSAIRANLQTEVDTICSHTRYTNAAKVQLIAQVILDARAQATALRDEFVTTSEETRRTLARKLFGLPANADPATVVVYRDSVDRAECLTDDELAPALARATDSGDQLLARAIAARADKRGLTAIAASYAESNGQAAAYAELADLPSGRNFSAAVAVVFSVPTPTLPADLAAIINGVAPGVLTGDDASGKLQKLADTTPAQSTKPQARTYRPGSVGTVLR